MFHVKQTVFKSKNKTLFHVKQTKMQQEKDYIKREIKKIIQFLKKAIELLLRENSSEKQIIESEEFASFFNFKITDLISLNNKDFIQNMKSMDSKILENLLLLFLELAKKNILSNKKSIKEKALILIEIIDEKEKTYSLERMQLKQKLKQF